MKSKIIGVGGQLGSGKDELSDYLQDRLNLLAGPPKWTRGAFALGVKRVFCDNFDKTLEFVEEWKRKDEIPPGMDMPVRKCLQWIGDGFRQIRSTIWMDLALRGPAPKIISDVRYINELDRIHLDGGFNVLIWRLGNENNDPHPSEAELAAIIRWYRDTGYEGRVLPSWQENAPPMPRGANRVHYFIRNEEGLQEYRVKTDRLVRFVLDYFYGQQ
jgi:hypothetical protein